MDHSVKNLRNAVMGRLQVLTHFTLETNGSEDQLLLLHPETNEQHGFIQFELSTLHTGFTVFYNVRREIDDSSETFNMPVFTFDLGSTNLLSHKQFRLSKGRSIVTNIPDPDWNDFVNQDVEMWAYLRTIHEVENLAKALNILYRIDTEDVDAGDLLDDICEWYDIPNVAYWAYGVSTELDKYTLADDVALFFNADLARELVGDPDEEDEDFDDEEDEDDYEEEEEMDDLDLTDEEKAQINKLSQVLERYTTEDLLTLHSFYSEAPDYLYGIKLRHFLIAYLEMRDLESLREACRQADILEIEIP